MAMKLKEVIEKLSKFPQESLCYAYEGEVTGIIIVSNNVIIGEVLTGGEPIQLQLESLDRRVLKSHVELKEDNEDRG